MDWKSVIFAIIVSNIISSSIDYKLLTAKVYPYVDKNIEETRVYVDSSLIPATNSSMETLNLIIDLNEHVRGAIK